MHILIIEDEISIRQTLQELLELNGHTVTAAADGIEGVRLAEQRPELILCDIGMPGMDGFQAITAIQKLPQCRDIPFIFLTARADREDQRRGMSLGADDYITKPFTERDLIDAIAARVRRQQPLRERIERLLSERQREIDASWSHELMTPLSGVLGGLELIESEADSIKPEELRELLALIRGGAERQQNLSRKLVLYYELERMKSAPPPAKPNRCEAAECAAAGASRAARDEKRGGDLTVRCESCSVRGFEAHLLAAVAELVVNAFRFSKPGDPVSVTGTRQADRYRIQVIDRGPGMTAEQRADIAAFTQFGRSQHEQQGLGLGLAIAKMAAELAGGQLLLEAVGPGDRGLKATLDLPTG